MRAYGDSFGFRRSNIELWSGGEGRQRVPATGTFLQGDLVEFDPAAAGFVKKSAANAAPEPGVRGLAIQESAHIGSVFDGAFPTQERLEVLKNGETLLILTGGGIKVWMKNRAASQRSGGQPVSARTIVDLTGVAIMDYLAWDGSKYIKTTTAANGVFRVTLVDAAAGYVEGTLVR